MNLNIEEWGTFKIKDLFPKVTVNKYSSIPESEGVVPFISSTSENNGVTTYCNEESIPGNCITVSTNGECLDAFYHSERIAISSDVEVLYSKKLNAKNALFICTIIKWNKYKFSYGRKAKSGKLFALELKLPQTSLGKPDWDFMENYIKSLNHKPITTKNLFRGGARITYTWD